MTQRSRTARAPRRQPVATQRNFPLIPVVIGAAVVLVIAVVLAVVLSGTGGRSTSGEPAREPVKVSGQPLAAYPAAGSGGADPAVGQTIPTVTGVTFDNSPVSIGPQDGPMVVILLAHWCPHCQNEVPRVQQWLDSGGLPDGVKLVSVATSTSQTRPNYPPSAWLKREKWTPPVLVDDASSTALQAFGMDSFPAFVFVDADGKVAARTTGELAIDQLEAITKQLAAG